MKIIKTLLLGAIGLCTTTLLHAQELKHAQQLKTEVSKPTEIKAPPTDVANRPSPAPEFKPMNGVAATEAPVAASQTASPLKKDENKPQPEAPRMQVVTKETNGPKNNLTAEQLKTLNGTAEKPKQAVADAQLIVTPAISLAPAPVMIKN